MIAREKDGIPGLEKITGDTVEITEYLNFAFWDLFWSGGDPEDGPCLRRWLGCSHCVGPEVLNQEQQFNMLLEMIWNCQVQKLCRII